MIANDVATGGKRIYNFTAPAVNGEVTIKSLLSAAQKAEIDNGLIKCLSLFLYVAGASDLVFVDDIDSTQKFSLATGGSFELPYTRALETLVSSSDGTPVAVKAFMLCA